MYGNLENVRLIIFITKQESFSNTYFCNLIVIFVIYSFFFFINVYIVCVSVIYSLRLFT